MRPLDAGADRPAPRSLKGDRAFQRVRKGRAGHSRLLSLRWISNREGHIRVGIVVSKKVGKAVVRNRVRRRLREALRLAVKERGLIAGAADLVIIARPEAAAASYRELEQNLHHALKKAALA